MSAIILWSVRNRFLTASGALLWFVASAVIAYDAPLDVFPEFVPPQVEVQTEAPGFDPEQVDELVTRVVEERIRGAPGLETVRSESIYGISVVNLTFKEGADPYIVRQGIAERIANVDAALPVGVAKPTLSPLTSSTMDVLKIGLVSDTADPFALRDAADWIVKPQLLAVPGVARASVFGGAVRQIHIEPRVDRLTSLGLTIADVLNASRAALVARGAGFIDTGPQRVTLAANSHTPDPREMAKVLIATQGNVPIRLGDVANVTIAPAVEVGDAVVQGRKGVLLTLSGQFGENTLAVTQRIESVLMALTAKLSEQGIRVYPALHRPATFIERAMRNLWHALVIGGALILAILYLFLRNIRAVAIAFVTIPLSMLTAVVVLVGLGQSLNTMTLGGLAVAVGVIVDDAIIDIENIARRLRMAPSSADRLKIITDASVEIRSSIYFGTLATIFVFMPLLFIGGVQGRLLAPLGLSFILAVVASLAVAVTATPALCALMLPPHGNPPAAWIVRIERTHLHAMTMAGRRAGLIAATLLASTVLIATQLPNLQAELMPAFREGHFVAQVSSAASGTSLEEMAALGERLSARLLRLPFVATVEQQIGRAAAGEDTWPTDKSEFHIELTANHAEAEDVAQEQIRATFAAEPGVTSETLTFLGDRIGESIGGETSQAVVRVVGSDLAEVASAADRIESAIRGVHGIADLQVSRGTNAPTISIRFDAAKLTGYGLTEQDARDALEAAFTGVTVGQTYEGSRTVDVVVILPASARNTLDALNQLVIGNATTKVPLRNVAEIGITASGSSILRHAGERCVMLTFNAHGVPLRRIVSAVQAHIDRVVTPQNVLVLLSSQADEAARGQLRLGALALISIALVILSLCGAFRRRWLAALVLVNLPFGLIGGVFGILVGGQGLSLGSLVGLVVIFGIAARNSIMLLSHAEHLIDIDGETRPRAALHRAALERLTPILMTTAVTMLGMLPLAFGAGRAGYEIEAPMAVAVLGGLASATLLNLILLPELAIRLLERSLRKRKTATIGS